MTGAATAISTTATATSPHSADMGERRTNRPNDRPARLQLDGLAARTADRCSGVGLTVASGVVTVISDVSSGPARR